MPGGDRPVPSPARPGDGPPDFAGAREHVIVQLVRFARSLRAGGARVPADGALSAARALAAVGLDDRTRVEAATRASLLSDPRDDAVFDDQFPQFWYRLRTGLEAAATVDDDAERTATSGMRATAESPGEAATAETTTAEAPAGGERIGDPEVTSRRIAERPASDDGGEDAAGDETDVRPGTFSATGSATDVDSGAELLGGAVEPGTLRRFERALSNAADRRWARGGADRVDVRRAIRRSLSTGGVPVELPGRERDETAFRATVLVDVSRSVLDAVDRGFLLSVLDGLVDDGRGVRVFFFDTDLQEVTDAFDRSRGNPAAALERAEVAWGGGTRIGDALRTLREQWPDAVDRRTPVIVVSDGLDVGEVDVLDREMVWLSGRAASVIWFNPLATSTAYEPTCRGMAAALPYVDGLFAFGGNADLAEAARQLDRHGPRGPVGYRHDFRERPELDEGEGGATA